MPNASRNVAPSKASSVSLCHRWLAVGITLSALLVAACDENPNSLLDRRNVPSSADENELSPEALRCVDKPEGRSYVLFDGTKLEDKRVDEGTAVNRARFKPHAVMAGEYQRVLGVVPKSLDRAGTAFDAPPERWSTEPAHSGVSLNAVFAISFEACGAHVASSSEYGQAPTEETASHFCSVTMRKAWSRTPSPAELADCVGLATKKLAEEADARRKWSYVCASLLSSSQFLTY